MNSFAHVWGEQPFNTGDDSKNNVWVAMVSSGEGWHNNHHAFPRSARHGLFPPLASISPDLPSCCLRASFNSI